MDVCPFIPVKNVTMEDCVECAKEFAERLAVELGIPGNSPLFRQKIRVRFKYILV